MPREATPRIVLSFSTAPVRGMSDAGRREDALHAGARIGRAAHHLHLAVAGIDDADPQPVGVGVRLGRDDARDVKPASAGGAVLDALDIVAEHDQPLDDLVDRRVGVEMGLEPGRASSSSLQRRPRTSEGMSSGRKP